MRKFFFFFFKQKTAYEIRKGDWSSDVCSSDLRAARAHARADRRGQRGRRAARGDPGRGLRGGRLAPRQADRPVPRDLGHPRRRLLRAVPLGAPPRLLQERQQPHAERARSAVASAGAQGMRGALAPRGVTMNRIEAMKAEKDGLDVQEDLARFAREGWKTLGDDDKERLKWVGVFHRRPTPGHFMMRVRMPNGIVSAAQARLRRGR